MRWGRIALGVLCALWFAATAALAFDEAVVRQAEGAIEGYKSEIARVAQELQNPVQTEAGLAEHRIKLEEIRAGAAGHAANLIGPVAEIDQQIELLGKSAAEKEEPAAIAAERAELQATRDRLAGAKSRLDLIVVEAEQMVGRVATQQRRNFFQRIFEADRSIVDPSLWQDTAAGIGILFSRLGNLFHTWWNDVSPAANLNGLAIAPLLFIVVALAYRFGRRWLRSRMGVTAGGHDTPDDIGRLWRIVRLLANALVFIFAVVFPAYLALVFSGLLTPRFELVINALIDVFAATLLYYVLARGVAAPGQPAWRIIDVDEATAKRLPLLVGLAGFLSVGNEMMIELADALFMSVAYIIGQSALTAFGMLALTALVVWTLRNQTGVPERNPGRLYYFNWTRVFVLPAWLLVIAGLVSLLLGYLSLANYIAQQLFQTGILVAALFLLHHLSDAAVAASFDPQSGFGKFLRRVTGFGERAIERLGLLFRTAVDILLLVIGIAMLLVLWTVTWIDFRSLLNTALIGVSFGGITISPLTIFAVLATLAIGIALTNLVIRWFDRRILRETRIDKGVQDSLRKGASYTGYALAVGMALSAAGLDFSNIAIIAGALGVGIGFGLQSIVNNFISGLILLVERPIRVGDWVKLDAGEGLVKRINVRSTEIETFDSCSIIVPNLSLITGAVRNWTLHDTTSSFMVAVTAGYGSDAQQVRGILMEAARSHPKVLTYPEPGVVLAKLGQVGLDFELRASVADVFDAGNVASDIRFEILERFREKGITIPRPVALIDTLNKQG